MDAAQWHPLSAGQPGKILGADGRWYDEDIAIQRYLLTEGALGALPDWYALIRAARYLNVAPWELLKQPYFWQRIAITAERIENHVQEELQRRAEAEASVKA